MNNSLETLKELCSLTQTRWERTHDTKKIESLLLQILDFIKTHERERFQFSKYFINWIHGKLRFPMEVIVFTMRELQWPEIKKAAVEEQGNTDDWRIISALNDVLAVYETEWEDADLYEYYSKK